MQSMSNPYEGYTDTNRLIGKRPTPRSLRLSRDAGVYAGIFALALVVFSLAGVVWGVLRPTYTAYIEDAETATVAAAENVEFSAFIWFAIGTGLIGATIALISFLKAESARGPGMLLWVGLVALVGAGAFMVSGDFTTGMMYPRPDDYAAAVGESFQVVPGISPGSALFAAPFLAVLMYWCATFVTPPDEESEEPSDT